MLLRSAVRARSRLPAEVWPLLTQIGALVGSDAPLAGLPAVRRVLVVAPHPDDETIGCGGTIARLADRGAAVTVVVVTDGTATVGTPHPPDETARRRRAETATACAILGAPPPRFLGLPDGTVSQHTDDLRGGLVDVVADTRPEIVLAPWPLDRHPDHQACAAAVAHLPVPAVWGYETHVPTTATRAVDITPVVDRKRRALQAHVTAGHAMDLDATLGLNRWRSLHVTAGDGWAEGFLALPLAEWRTAVALAGELAPR
jgi:N-acetylglucosamine malate deacetylase 1